jgi:hypothetical protein
MTTTIRCGKCNGTHPSAAAVRTCYAIDDPFAGTAAVTEDEYEAAKEAIVNPPQPLATERQRDYLVILLTELGEPADLPDDLNRKDASEAISAAKERKYSGMTADEVTGRVSVGGGAKYVLEDGVYQRPSGEVVVVYHTVHGANEQVAKVLVVNEEEDGFSHEWKYEGKRGLAGLTKNDRLSHEAAAELGMLYGFCVRCCRTLTREESQFVGYGKTCAGHEGWPYPTKKELREMTKRREERFTWQEGDIEVVS